MTPAEESQWLERRAASIGVRVGGPPLDADEERLVNALARMALELRKLRDGERRRRGSRRADFLLALRDACHEVNDSTRVLVASAYGMLSEDMHAYSLPPHYTEASHYDSLISRQTSEHQRFASHVARYGGIEAWPTEKYDGQIGDIPPDSDARTRAEFLRRQPRSVRRGLADSSRQQAAAHRQEAERQDRRAKRIFRA